MFDRIKAAMYEQLVAAVWYVSEKIESTTWHAIDYAFSGRQFKFVINEDTADPEIVRIAKKYMHGSTIVINDPDEPPLSKVNIDTEIDEAQNLEKTTMPPKILETTHEEKKLQPETKTINKPAAGVTPKKLPPEIKTNALLAKEYFTQKKYKEAFDASLTAIAEDDKDEDSRIIFIESVVKTNKKQFAKKAVIELAKFTVYNNPKHLLILAKLCNMVGEFEDRNINLMALFQIDFTQLPGDMGKELRDETLAFLATLARQPNELISDYKADWEYYNRGEKFLKKGDYIKAALDFSCAIWLNLQDPSKILPVVYIESRRNTFALMSSPRSLKYAEKDHEQLMAIFQTDEKTTPVQKTPHQRKHNQATKSLTLHRDQYAIDFSNLLLTVARERINKKDNEAATAYLDAAERHYPQKSFKNIFNRNLVECRKLLALHTQSLDPKISSPEKNAAQPEPSEVTKEAKLVSKSKRAKQQALQAKKEKDKSAKEMRDKKATLNLNIKFQKLQDSIAEENKKADEEKSKKAAKAKIKREAAKKRAAEVQAAEEQRLNELALKKAADETRKAEEKAREDARQREEKIRDEALKAAEKAKKEREEAQRLAIKLKRETEEKEQKARAAEEKARRIQETKLDALAKELVDQTLPQVFQELNEEYALEKHLDEMLAAKKMFEERKRQEEKTATDQTIQLEKFEKDILNFLESKLANTKIVGSSVSERLRNGGKFDPTKDVDIVTAATKEQILSLNNAGLGFYFSEVPDQKELSFHCDYHYTVPNTEKVIVIPIDIWRSDALNTSLKNDANKRDFNPLYADLKGKVYDPTGQGLNDLNNKIVSTVVHPQISFQEDPLRILRAIGKTAGTQDRLDDRKIWTEIKTQPNQSPKKISMKDVIQSWTFTFSDDPGTKNNPRRINSWFLKKLIGPKTPELLEGLINEKIIEKLFSQFSPGITLYKDWIAKQLSLPPEPKTKIHPLNKIYTHFLVCGFMTNQVNLVEGFNYIFQNKLLKTYFNTMPMEDFVEYFNKVCNQWKKDYIVNPSKSTFEQKQEIPGPTLQKREIENLIKTEWNFGLFDWGLNSIMKHSDGGKLTLQQFHEKYIQQTTLSPNSPKSPDPRLFRSSFQGAPTLNSSGIRFIPQGRMQNSLF